MEVLNQTDYSVTIYDTLIVGAGPAGMTAALYLLRAGKSVLLVDKSGYGGNIARSPLVENIPAFSSVSGMDWAGTMYNQISDLGVVFEVDEIFACRYKNGLIFATGAENTYCAKSIILAVGTEPKKLQLNTKDIYYCVTCDGPFFKNKSVLVVGSGNTGATFALELANYCKEVYMCDITKKMVCEPILGSRISNSSNIIWLPSTTVKDVKNNKNGRLAGALLSDGTEIKISGIFVAMGMTSNLVNFSNILPLDEYNYATIDESCMQKDAPGIYVAGDCRAKTIRQVTTACSDGTIAAIQTLKYLNGLSE